MPAGGCWAASWCSGSCAGSPSQPSYQLVALAAKKNTISLGLGCVASGLVVLGLETGLGLASMPSHMQRVALFGACTGMKGCVGMRGCLKMQQGRQC